MSLPGRLLLRQLLRQLTELYQSRDNARVDNHIGAMITRDCARARASACMKGRNERKRRSRFVEIAEDATVWP